MTDGKPPSAGRDIRRIVVWSAVIGILLLAVAVVSALVVPVVQVRRVIPSIPTDDNPDYAANCAKIVESLGGPEETCRKVGIYLSAPDRVAPGKGLAVNVLAATGDAGIPQMLRHMDNPAMEVSSAVLWRMCKGHPSAGHAVVRLARVACGKEDLLAYSAIIALGRVGPGAAEAVPALCECLKHPNNARRRYAARSLGQIGDRRAVDALKVALADEDPEARSAAEEAMQKLTPSGGRTVEPGSLEP